MDNSKLAELLLVWMGAVGAIAAARWRRGTPGSGLVLAYLINLWMIHWVAAAIYLLPWYQGYDPRIVEAGFEQSAYGVAAFAFGSLALAPLLIDLGVFPRAKGWHQPDTRLPKAYIALGLGSYAVLSTFLGRLSSATALAASGQQLIVVGLGLSCWKAWKEGDSRKLAGWLAVTLLLPFGTIVTRGFIGYGAVAAFAVFIFVFSFLRTRLRLLPAGFLLVFLGLSVYVSYMRDRNEIREVVWGGQPLSDRVDRVWQTFSTFEWFDPQNQDHLARVDRRLNQSFLVGAAVMKLSETGGYANGETFWEALLALVPRALWPEKPVTAGSGTLVSQYTGFQFAAGTSVGVGQVMEFYINFGTMGVVIGFLALGVMITVLDISAAERLGRGDLHGFVLCFLPGLAFLQAGGQLLEVTSTAAASLVVAMAANRYLDRLQGKHGEAPKTPRVGMVTGVRRGLRATRG